MNRIYIKALIFVTGLLAAHCALADTNGAVLSMFAGNPFEPSLRAQIKQMIPNESGDRREKLIAAYALASLGASNFSEYKAATRYLSRNYPRSLYMQSLYDPKMLVQCSNCLGEGNMIASCAYCGKTGMCQGCDGKGMVKRKGFNGEVKIDKCLHCHGTGKCSKLRRAGEQEQ